MLKWTYVCVGVPTRLPACARVPAQVHACARCTAPGDGAAAVLRLLPHAAPGTHSGTTGATSRSASSSSTSRAISRRHARATSADIRQRRGKRRIATTSAQRGHPPRDLSHAALVAVAWPPLHVARSPLHVAPSPLHVAPLAAAAQTVDVMHELTEKPIKGLFPDDSTSGAS